MPRLLVLLLRSGIKSSSVKATGKDFYAAVRSRRSSSTEGAESDATRECGTSLGKFSRRTKRPGPPWRRSDAGSEQRSALEPPRVFDDFDPASRRVYQHLVCAGDASVAQGAPPIRGLSWREPRAGHVSSVVTRALAAPRPVVDPA